MPPQPKENSFSTAWTAVLTHLGMAAPILIFGYFFLMQSVENAIAEEVNGQEAYIHEIQKKQVELSIEIRHVREQQRILHNKIDRVEEILLRRLPKLAEESPPPSPRS